MEGSWEMGRNHPPAPRSIKNLLVIDNIAVNPKKQSPPFGTETKAADLVPRP